MIGQHEGGNERYTKNLAVHLSKIVDTTVLLYKKVSMNSPGLKMVIFPHNDFFRLIFLPALMLKSGYTVLHSNYITPLWKAPKHRYVVMVHDLGFRRFPDIYGLKDTLIFKLLFPYSLRLADIIIVPSEFIKNEFTHFYPGFGKKVEVIYEGIDPIFLEKNSPKIKGKKQNSSPYLLCIASRSPRKNIPLVLDAFLKAELSDVSLYIIGYKPLGTQAILSKKIKYLGYVSDIKLRHLYANALALIYISSYEGFGLPPVEALACKTPVLASDIPSLHEICGKYVDYIQWEDSKALIRYMKRYSSSKGTVTDSNLFVRKYDWNRTALSFYSILQKYYPCYNRGT